MSELTKLRVLRLLRVTTFIAGAFLLQLFSSDALWAGMVPDPACEQQCEDDYLFCLDYICDPRGTCTCWSEYQSCVSYCPLVCQEPKSVRNYTVAVYSNVQQTSVTACLKQAASLKVHNKTYFQFRIYTYRETTHCNGTKTTELLSVGPLSGQQTCWQPYYPQISCGSDAENNCPTCYPRCPSFQ
jgi:hypothetical protein